MLSRITGEKGRQFAAVRRSRQFPTWRKHRIEQTKHNCSANDDALPSVLSWRTVGWRDRHGKPPTVRLLCYRTLKSRDL
jgi:hypothetical protein